MYLLMASALWSLLFDIFLFFWIGLWFWLPCGRCSDAWACGGVQLCIVLMISGESILANEWLVLQCSLLFLIIFPCWTWQWVLSGPKWFPHWEVQLRLLPRSWIVLERRRYDRSFLLSCCTNLGSCLCRRSLPQRWYWLWLLFILLFCSDGYSIVVVCLFGVVIFPCSYWQRLLLKEWINRRKRI